VEANKFSAMEGRMKRQYEEKLNEMKEDIQIMKNEMNIVHSVIEKTNSEVARTAEWISEMDQRQKDHHAQTIRYQEDMQQESKRAHERMAETQIQGQNAQAQAQEQSQADMKDLFLQFFSTVYSSDSTDARITGRSGIKWHMEWRWRSNIYSPLLQGTR